MTEPRWLHKSVVKALHDEQLAEHGGSSGLRDKALLESALAKPQNVFAYEEEVSLSRLAASYAFGLARNHAFVDGNKRIALVVSIAFLGINGWEVNVTWEGAYFTFLHLAEGVLGELELAEWMEAHAVPL